MANTSLASGLVVAQWSSKFFREYVRDSRFFRYMGESENNVICVNKDLSKKAGDNITFGLVIELSNSGVTGDDTLEGNEEAMTTYSDTVTVNQIRNAVAIGHMEQQKTMVDLLDVARERLKKWAMARLRDLMVARLICYSVDGTTAYASATESQKDTALTANTDRVLFGALLSNRSTTDHSASLSNVDTSNDTFVAARVSLLRRIATGADPAIAPITASEDEEWYVCFAGTNPYRDLKADLATEHQNAAPRSMKDNPLWRHGDLVWDGVVIRQIPELTSIGDVGDTSAPVYSTPLCGQQAVLLAWAEMTRAIRNGRDGSDYGNIRGVGVAELRAAKTAVFNSVFHGRVTGYFAAAADA
jgi:N4-gp56 family major capsid protein